MLILEDLNLKENPVYSVKLPPTLNVPLLISVPHCGTRLTPDYPDCVAHPDILNVPDTDWYVHVLYDFAPSMGIPLIHANYSRYIIDLNRPLPGEPSLYENTDRVTELVSMKTFDKKNIYKENRQPNDLDIQERIETYYHPYYDAIDKILDALRSKFKTVMLYDGHSIKGHVSSIQEEPFLDYLPGNRSGKTCPDIFMETIQSVVKQHNRTCATNFPFQGGNITRHFYSKSKGIITFQLEISQRIYMNEETLEKPEERWSETKMILKEVIEQFTAILHQLNQ